MVQESDVFYFGMRIMKCFKRVMCVLFWNEDNEMFQESDVLFWNEDNEMFQETDVCFISKVCGCPQGGSGSCGQRESKTSIPLWTL